MPVATGPIAVTPGTTTALANPLPSPAGTPWFVLVGNNSAYPILMSVAGVQTWVQPFTATLLSGEGSGEITATTNALPNGSIGPGTPAYLTLTWALYPETIPGNYPCPLPLPTSAPSAMSVSSYFGVSSVFPTILAAPGAGIAYVIYGASIGAVNTATATAIMAVQLVGGSTVIATCLSAPVSTPSNSWAAHLPANGLQLPTDTAVTLTVKAAFGSLEEVYAAFSLTYATVTA